MNSFIENLKNFFSMPVSGTGGFIRLNIKCNRCGEEISCGIRTTSDLSRLYDEDKGPQGAAFFVRKEVLGSKCNNLIYLSAYFNENLKMVSSDITGGKIIEK